MKVFLSSSFLDMIEERDTLQKSLFPVLRSQLQQIGLSLNQVDLRWGISSSQIERGDYVRMCMERATECDLLVGLLGHRYGTKLKPAWLAAAASRFPWIKEYPNASLTELEIRAAIEISKKSKKPSLIFGFKEKGWSYCNDRIRLQIPEKFRDLAPNQLDDINDHDIEQMKALKQELRDSGFICFDYKNAAECDEVLREHVSEFVILPQRCATDRSLKNCSHYVPHEKVQSSLWSSLTSADEKRIVVQGEIGGGKTESLIEFARHCSDSNYQVIHFQNLERESLLGSIYRQLQNHVRNPFKELGPFSLRSNFWQWIQDVSKLERPLLILDGIERCEQSPFDSWSWLWSLIPNNVPIIAALPLRERLDKYSLTSFKAISIERHSKSGNVKILENILAEFGKKDVTEVKNWFSPFLGRRPLELKLLVDGLHLEDSETLVDKVKDFSQFQLPEIVSRQWADLTQLTERPKELSILRSSLILLRLSKNGLYKNELSSMLQRLEPDSQLVDPANYCLVQLSGYLDCQEDFVNFNSPVCLDADMAPHKLEIERCVNVYLEHFAHPDYPVIRVWQAVFPLLRKFRNSVDRSVTDRCARLVLNALASVEAFPILVRFRFHEVCFLTRHASVLPELKKTVTDFLSSAKDSDPEIIEICFFLLECVVQSSTEGTFFQSIESLSKLPPLGILHWCVWNAKNGGDEETLRATLLVQLEETVHVVDAYLLAAEFELIFKNFEIARTILEQFENGDIAELQQAKCNVLRAETELAANNIETAETMLGNAIREFETHCRYDLVLSAQQRLGHLLSLHKPLECEGYLAKSEASATEWLPRTYFHRYLNLRYRNFLNLDRCQFDIEIPYRLNKFFVSEFGSISSLLRELAGRVHRIK